MIQWICRRCNRTHVEVKTDPSTEMIKECSFCGTENWCSLVTSDHLEPMTATEFEGKTDEQVEAVTEALTDDGVDMVIEPPLEAVTEAIIDEADIPNEDIEAPIISLDTATSGSAKEREEARSAEIGRLEAELERLRPKR